MLGTFPKDFSQVAISQGLISPQVATFPNLLFPKQQLSSMSWRSAGPPHVQAMALGPLAHPSLIAWPPLQSAVPQRA